MKDRDIIDVAATYGPFTVEHIRRRGWCVVRGFIVYCEKCHTVKVARRIASALAAQEALDS